MAWVATAEGEQESKRSGCVVLRELPSRPTQRICKLSSDLDAKSRASDLKALSGSHDQQQKQLQAFSSAWENISTTLKDLQHHTLAPVANQLQQWVASNGPVQSSHGYGPSSSSSTGDVQMMGPTAAGKLPCSSNQLPIVALSVASSTSTAATYAELLFTVKSKGHPVALVSARGASSGLSAIINSAMRSFFNEPTAADDIPALLAWWHDACQTPAGSTGHDAKAQSSADALVADTDAATPQGGNQAAAAAPARELRARTPAKTPAKPGNAKQSSIGVKQLGPPVLVLQDADSGDMEALEELVVALSEARVAGLPIVLVLGINITPSHLLQLLPNGVLRRAHLTALPLPPARTQVTQLYRALLLRGPQPLLALGPQISDWLLQHFRDVDCSAAMTERVLQLACVEHFRQQPLSCLVAAAATGSRRAVAAAVKQLDQEVLLLCCKALLSHPAKAATSSTGICSPEKEQSDRSAPTAAMTSVQQLQVFVKQDSGRNSNDAVTAPAAEVLHDSVWTAMQHYGKWRLGVLLLDMLARFTGAADVDASLQLPAIYTAASQPNFLTVKKKGNLSNCGKLLMKLLGDSNQGSSTRSRAGVTVVRALSGSECLQLLGKLVGLLQDAQLTQQQRQKQQRQHRQHRQQAQLAQGAMAVDAPHDDGSSSGSDSESDSESQGHATAKDDAAQGHDSAVASCESVQQLQRALQELQFASGAAEQQSPARKAAPNPTLDSVFDCQDPQDQQQRKLEQLERFAQQFKVLLSPLPDLVVTAAVAPGAAGGSLISTPAGKGQCLAAAAAGTGQDAVTPGGLASLLRKQVRFAPDTPDHANGKHAGGSSSTRSTPSDVSAASPVPGLIKTPSKKGSRSTQPKRLFAAAAAANAAAAAAKQPRRRKGDKKQAAEEGEVAGSSAAVLAAAVGLVQPSAATPAAAGNKRTQRLMQMMAASGPSPDAAGIRQNSGSGRSSVTTRRTAGSAVAVGAAAGQACSLTPPAPPSPVVAVDDSPDDSMLSDRAGRTCSSNRAASSSAGTRPSLEGSRTAGLATRTGSRLSKQSEPAVEQQHQQQVEDVGEEDTDTEQHENADPAGTDSMKEQPQHKQHTEPAVTAEPALTCASTLAALLEAVIPKLLLEWSCPAASSSTTPEAVASGGASSTPLAVAAAAAFVYDDLDMIRSMLSPAPPCAVHAALVDPSQKLPGHSQQLQDGCEDTCLAYVLLQQQRDDSLAVSDWFGLFCQAQGLQGFRGNEGGVLGYSNDSDLDDSDAEQAPVGRAARNKARKGRKAMGCAEARETKTGEAGLSSGKGTGKKRAAASSSSKAETANEADVAVDEQELLCTAARFCQAAAELQVLGVWKAAKKRRMAAVHRVFAPGGQLMAGAADLDSLPDHDIE